MKLNRFETQAKQALKQCLADIPFLEISEAVATRRAGPDLVLRIELPQGQRTIIAECKDSGQPRWIREAVNQILRYKESFPDAYPAVIAPYISPAAAEICRREGVGYADLAGNCWLAFDQVYIRKEGQPNPFSERRELRSLYSPKASRILRVLLFNPCSREIDPDRKSTTVIQSLLGSMEMSRENFESRLRGTLDRIEICNRDREVPIEVRLYSEKPSFRVVAAGNTLFLGAINPRDASGEIPLYETVENHDGASLHGAAHSHFQRVWADSTPVEVQTTATVQSLAAHPMAQEPGANSRSSRFSVVSGSIAS